MWSSPGSSVDAPHVVGSDVSGAQHEQETFAAQNLTCAPPIFHGVYL
jgi:hypothetical protein